MSIKPTRDMTPGEILKELQTYNPFAGYKLPKNEQERRTQRETLERYRASK